VEAPNIVIRTDGLQERLRSMFKLKTRHMQYQAIARCLRSLGYRPLNKA
jgi:hypothetical protein